MKKQITSGYWTDRLGPDWWAEIMSLTYARARIIITDGSYMENGW